jgi:hypothetical protein
MVPHGVIRLRRLSIAADVSDRARGTIKEEEL